MKLSMNRLDLQLLFISAFRYALGRRSYITSTMAHIIKDNSDVLTDQTVDLMIREIRNCKDLGMDCDRRAWEDLAKFLSGGNDD